MPTLDLQPARSALTHLASAVAAAVSALPTALADQIQVAAIDPDHADTATFCEVYDWDAREGANCLVVRATRGERTTHAAVLVRSDARADINGVVRRLLEARKAGFAAMSDAVELTGMEYGGITPIGLPGDWRVLVDARLTDAPRLVIGAGIRGAKVFLPGAVLAQLPGVEVVTGLAQDPAASNEGP